MTSKRIALFLALFAASVIQAQDKTPAPGKAPAADQSELKDVKQKVSYAIGMDIGNNFKRQDVEIDPKLLAAGIADALAGKTKLTDEQAKEAIMAFQVEMRAKMEAKQKEAGEKNVKEGEKFLADNAKKEGVKTTASGLQYKVLKAGKPDGKSPKGNDTVKVHYHGTLIDGTVFDSSVQRGEPATFGVGEVIPGWTEVLQLMKEGDKWQVFIPSKLAYGPRGFPPQIAPNSTLIFDVELLSIEKAN